MTNRLYNSERTLNMKIIRKFLSAFISTAMLFMVLTSTFALASLNLGDINDDGNIDAVDASLVLSAYAYSATHGGNNNLNAEEKAIADVNDDGNVDAVDASMILSYYAYKATGGIMSFPSFILNPPSEPITVPPTEVSVEQSSETDSTQVVVYYTATGSKYHYENPCGRGNYLPCTLQEAIDRGLEPCDKCVLH